MIATPFHGAVEVSPCSGDLAKLEAGHRQEEEVEGVGPALAGRQALFQGGDRLVELTRAVLGDAERVEEDRRLRGQLDGAAGQGQGPLRVASRFRRGSSAQAKLLQYLASIPRIWGWSGWRASAVSRSAIRGS